MTRIERARTVARKRVRTASGWRIVAVVTWQTRRTTVTVPAAPAPPPQTCPGYMEAIDALQTIAHETAHVAGVLDEGVAECVGLQTAALVAAGLDADDEFAYEIGRDYAPLYEAFTRANSEYAAPGCRDGGTLDLWPSLHGWPTPRLGTRLAQVVSPAAAPRG